jgi:hypothetical protein
VERDNRLPADDEEVRKWQSEDGSWNIGIGFADRPAEFNRWPGHLVTVCGNWLPDLSIGQANRPEHGIILPDTWMFEVDDVFLQGSTPRIARCENGALARYQAYPMHSGYEKAPHWTDEKRRRQICGPVIPQN